MSDQQSRRDFLRNAALTGMGVWVGVSARAQDNPKSANEKLNFACIGVGGKGDSDSWDASRFGNIVAICDVDENALNNKANQKDDKGNTPFAKAKRYRDYRKMFDEMGKQIDAVTVSIPDHSHAPATAIALHLGKAAYTQKPLSHSVYECRQLAMLARKYKCATQMGNQGTADNSMRKNAYKVRAGALGTVTEVHVWTDRPIWPQGIDRPPTKPVPSYLDWDLWLGPAPVRPYGDGYHTFAWRGWWDFGTGALGDMACHTVNLPFMALDLRYPTSVVATSSGTNHDSYPKSSKIIYEFPPTTIDGKPRPALTMTWYDGSNLPPKDLIPQDLLPENGKVPISGSLIIGDKGKLYTPGDYGGGGHIVDGNDVGEVAFPESPGHWEEFVAAIRGGKPAMSNFPDYASQLAETILLGNLAVWGEGEKIEWDAQNLKVKNGRATADKVAHIIHPVYRAGYHI
jgi:predicted dehydrogenase